MEAALAPISSDDEQAYSRRYTQDGINVVALDRRGRGLHRARPERRLRTAGFSSPPHPPGSRIASLVFGVVLLAAIGLLVARVVL